MKFLGETTKKRQFFSHGGCVVLRLNAEMPAGTSPAAVHLAKAVQALITYTEETLFPDAKAALTDAATLGHGYRFRPHTVQIALQEAPERNGFCANLTFSLTVGDQVLWLRHLNTHWDETGTVQWASPQPQKSGKRRIGTKHTEKNAV